MNSSLPGNPTIYEINTRVWMYELRQIYGDSMTLADVPEEILAGWQRVGFQVIWLMGVWERSPESKRVSNQNDAQLKEFLAALPDFTVDDNIGSAYAVRRYAVDPSLGGNQALFIFRERLREYGMRLILDFIPNHLSRDHDWVTDHPEFFIEGEASELLNNGGDFFEANGKILAHGKDPFFPPWRDTAQLNLFSSSTRLASANALDEIAGLCDGVRCDMAMLCLNDVFRQTWGERVGNPPEKEFWSELIDAIRLTHPNFLFIAEAYWDKETELLAQGFDACYDKVLYDRIIQGDPDPLLERLSTEQPPINKRVLFIENHDEKRIASRLSPLRSVQAAIMLATLPGYHLFHEGQIQGRKVHVPVFLQRRLDEKPIHDQERFYQVLIRTAVSPLCQEGEWKICKWSGWDDNQSHLNIVAWSWHYQGETLLVVLNLNDRQSQAHVSLPWDALRGREWKLVDLIQGDIYFRSGDEMTGAGMYVDLPGWGFHYLWMKNN